MKKLQFSFPKLVFSLFILISFTSFPSFSHAQDHVWWSVESYSYPGKDATTQISDGLGGNVSITYSDLKKNGNAVSSSNMWQNVYSGLTETPHQEPNDEIARSMDNTGELSSFTYENNPGMIRQIGSNYSSQWNSTVTIEYTVTLNFASYKASQTGAPTDGSTWSNTYLAISDIYSGGTSAALGGPWGYSSIEITAVKQGGGTPYYSSWSYFKSTAGLSTPSGNEPYNDFSISASSSSFKVEGDHNSVLAGAPGLGVDVGLIYIKMPSTERYTSLTLKFKMTDGPASAAGADNWAYGILSQDNGGSFPVEWMSFDVRKESGQAVLDWATAQEINSASFDIQRSMDGQNFAALGNVSASGTTDIPSYYSFRDTAVNGINASKVYYRLKQNDLDGAYSFSEVVEVEWTKSNEIFINTFPNPASDIVNITYQAEAAEKLDLTVLDLSGKEVYQQSFIPTNEAFVLNVADWAPGLYMVQLKHRFYKATSKLVVQ